MKSLIGAATAAALVAVTRLSGCGTITQGTSQDIAISTSPPGGHCELDRRGEHVASGSNTPDRVHVDKTKYNIDVTCSKPGYPDGRSSPWKAAMASACSATPLPRRRHRLGHRFRNRCRQQISQHGGCAAGAAGSRQRIGHPACRPHLVQARNREVAQLAQQNHYNVRLNCDLTGPFQNSWVIFCTSHWPAQLAPRRSRSRPGKHEMLAHAAAFQARWDGADTALAPVARCLEVLCWWRSR